jgi:hypothetical protein
VTDLVCGDVPQLLTWMANRPKHCTIIKLSNVMIAAASNGFTDICLAIMNSGRLSIYQLALTLQVACDHGHLAFAQIIVERYQFFFTFQHL